MNSRRVLVLVLALLAACAGWVRVKETEHAALRPGARLVTKEYRSRVVPPPTLNFVEVEGQTFSIRSVAALKPFLAPIDTPERAVDYSRLLRSFEIGDGEVIGCGESLTVEMGGVIPALFAERVRAMGMDPEPEVRATQTGFELERQVVVSGAPSELLLVREWIGRNGSYRYEIVKRLASGPEVESFIWHPR